ncbi:MAG: cytochrome c biogenesis protein CcdA [Pirellulaceae bacterium]
MIGQRRLTLRALPVALFLICVLPVYGQQASPAPPAPASAEASPSFGPLDQMEFGGDFPGLGGGDHFTATGQFEVAEGTRQGRLSISLTLDPHWHVYSITQKDGGPQRSDLEVAESDDYRLLGSFQASPAPKIKEVEFFNVPVEEHSGTVTWAAPIKISEGVNPQELEITVAYSGQVCEDEGSCIPISGREIVAFYAGTYTPVVPTNKPYREARSHVSITGFTEPNVVRPGESVQVSVAAAPDSGWHVYAYAEKDAETISKPTLIVVTPPESWRISTPHASATPKTELQETGELVSYHEGPVRWTVVLQVPQDAKPGEYQVTGSIGYQACTQSRCDRPLAAEFQTTVSVSDRGSGERTPLTFTSSSYNQVARLASQLLERAGPAEASAELTTELTSAPADRLKIDFWAELFKKLQFRESEEGWSHAWFPQIYMGPLTLKMVAVALALILGFLAGLILNVMPCVLPVIGLKLMSFISQAGEDRWRIFRLNVWYSLGMWVVFMVFAAVAAALHLLGETFAWGEHLGDPRFSVPLLILIYVLGLSMFGVWEIPIPGFMGTGAANDLAEKEGPAGAFFKGILTTVLATPCSGPFIGVAVGIAVIAPLWLNFAVFTSMALGMAFPYLVVGAFPQLIKVLPKPGNWMITLKQFMGFLLMGTGVWILYFLEDRFVIPVLAMLVGFGAACWVAGGTPITATFQQRVRSWVWVGVFTAVGALLFSALLPAPTDSATVQHRPSDDSPELPWERYTPDALKSYREQGHTVLVDFTADW